MVLGEDGSCPLAILLPFTERGRLLAPSGLRHPQTAYAHMASALMAMEDFNARDPSVIPQLADAEYSFDECSVYFPLPWDDRTTTSGTGINRPRIHSVIKDDGDKQDTTANALLSTLTQMRRHDDDDDRDGGGGDLGDNDDDDDDDDDPRKNHRLCAVAGNVANMPARAAATLSAASDVPYFSHAADTTKISIPSQYPMSGKLGPDEYARGDALVSYLSSIGRDKVVLAYSHTNEDVLKVTSKAARDHGVDLRYEPVGPPWEGNTTNTPYDAMRRIKESGFKTVIVSVPRMSQWEHMAREAQRWGVNTDEYVWLAWESTTDFDLMAMTRTSPGSDMDRLLRGMGSVRVLDGYDWKEDDKFLERWRGRDASFAEKLRIMNPLKRKGMGRPRNLQGATGGNLQGKSPPPPPPKPFEVKPDYFQEHSPMPFSSYMYDTVVALGMGACRTQKIQRQIEAQKMEEVGGGLFSDMGSLLGPNDYSPEDQEDGTARRLQGGPRPPGQLRPGPNLQYNETIKVTFDGASGFVRLDDGKIYTRNDKDISFGVYNLRPVDDLPPLENAPEETRSYEYAITSKRLPGRPWTEVPGEPFIYADGTSTQPTPVREVFENNYLSPAVRACGFALFAIAAFICVFLAAWTFVKRKKTIVKAYQPEFLYLVCFGSFVSLIAIITQSFDESYGTSVDTLSAMCTATPWFFFTGYITVYMALFSKLRRINSVLSFRRRVVKVHHVILPAIVLIMLAFVVLALWTALDPWVWVRETVDDESGETFGKCTSNNATGYIVTLATLMVVATLLAAMMTYKTKDISSQFSDAGQIFMAIVTQLEVWFVGIPILVIVDNVSVDASYLGRVLIIWTFALTMVLMVIGSKFIKSSACCSKKSNTARSTGTGGVHVTGVNLPVSNNATTASSAYSKSRISRNKSLEEAEKGVTLGNDADTQCARNNQDS